MDFQEEREAFEAWLFQTEKFKNRNKSFLFMLDENGNYEDIPVFEHWQTWRAAKAQAVPEQVLDAPACVGGGAFQKGVKWSTVIGAAQRHYENDGHHERPAVSVADQLRIASGHSVVVPREPTELMIRAACGSDDVNEMALLEQQYKQMIEAAREQKG